jgi:hypothetical protein
MVSDTFDGSVEPKGAVAPERIVMTSDGGIPLENRYTVALENRHRELLKRLREFPWLWGVSSSWAKNPTILIGRATPSILNATLTVEGTSRRRTFWVMCSATKNQQLFVFEVKPSTPCDFTLADLVCKAIREVSGECQILFFAEEEYVHLAGRSAMDDEHWFYTYRIIKPQRGDKNLNRACWDIAGERWKEYQPPVC